MSTQKKLVFQCTFICIELNELGKKKDDLGKNKFDPFIGQCFPSEEEAFIGYKK